MKRVPPFLICLLALTLLPSAALAVQPVHALVIGIDAYQFQGGELSDLLGAVNDARDIAAALEELGAATVRVLLNEEAHRTAILESWESLREAARPGDLLLLTFAGHGAQEPERFPGFERDGMDEVTVLGGFRTSAPHNFQRIMDYEWRRLVAAAADYTVMLVFDACHSGTMNRSLAAPHQGRARFGPYGPITEDQLPPPPSAASTPRAPGVLPHEIYLGATLDNLVVHEIQIGGEYRGALSYQFARALRGAADANRDGRITRGELAHFIQESVIQRSERRQHPVVVYDGADSAPLFTLPAHHLPPAVRVADHLPLALDNMTDTEQQALLAQLRRVTPADSQTAVLTWNAAARTLISQHGDVVAALPKVSARDQIALLQGVIDKWRVLPALMALNDGRHPLELRFTEGDGLHQEGDRLTLTLAPRRLPYLLLVNLPATGQVQFLYPQPNSEDALTVRPDEAFKLPFRIAPPFGGDHLIALTARDKPQAIYEALQSLDGDLAAEALYHALAEALRDGDNEYEWGVLAFYTAEKREY